MWYEKKNSKGMQVKVACDPATFSWSRPGWAMQALKLCGGRGGRVRSAQAFREILMA